MTRLRILYLHQYFNTLQDSGSTRSYEMARRLVRAGHEVHIVTTARSADKKDGWVLSQEDGIHVHSVSIPYSNAMSYADRIRAFARFALQATLKASAIPADVVFATSTPLTIAIPGVTAARRQKIPMVFEVRDLWPEIPIAIGALQNPVTVYLARTLERFAYRNAAQIVALSPGMKEGVVRAGYPAEKISVIPNSADLELFDVPASVGERFRQQVGWLGNRPLVVYAGTLGRINGVSYLAHLAAETQSLDGEIRFLIVGAGAEWERVHDLAAQLGVLGQNFFMLPSLPKNEVPAVLSAANIAASVFIDLPAMWTNSANKFFDALAAGTPIAINYRGWQAELLQQTGAGVVLSPRQIHSSAEQLVAFLHDKERLAAAGRAARQLARECFSRDAAATELEQVLLRAVTRGS